MIEGVTSDATSADAQFSIADTGELVYSRGGQLETDVTMAWGEGTGAPRPMWSTPGDYYNPRFSPDGSRLAVDIGSNWGQIAVWTYDVARDVPTRLTFGGVMDFNPVWTPDGRRIAFTSQRNGVAVENMYWQSADGAGKPERLAESPRMQYPWSWHPDGRQLAFYEVVSATNFDIGILPIQGSEDEGWKIGGPSIVLSSPFVEIDPAFSPDGRFLAYTSLESGRPEIFVRPYPSLQARWRISIDGGMTATWSPKSRELFYGTLDGRIMVASYQVSGETFLAAKPREWSSQARWTPRGGQRSFDLHPDGRRFALLRGAELPVRDNVTFVSNFFDILRRGPE